MVCKQTAALLFFWVCVGSGSVRLSLVQVAELQQVLLPHVGDKHEIQCVKDQQVIHLQRKPTC